MGGTLGSHDTGSLPAAASGQGWVCPLGLQKTGVCSGFFWVFAKLDPSTVLGPD
jgi:hypothetical protein